MGGTPHLPGTREFFTCTHGRVVLVVAAIATSWMRRRARVPRNLPLVPERRSDATGARRLRGGVRRLASDRCGRARLREPQSSSAWVPNLRAGLKGSKWSRDLLVDCRGLLRGARCATRRSRYGSGRVAMARTVPEAFLPAADAEPAGLHRPRSPARLAIRLLAGADEVERMRIEHTFWINPR